MIKKYKHFINEKNETVILYHGTDVEFDVFDELKISTGDSSELFGRGYYLTDSEDIALQYALQKTKSHKIDKYTHDGIFGTEIAHYTNDADQYARDHHVINSFKLIHANIFNANDDLSDDFLNVILESYKKNSGWNDSESVHLFNNCISYMRTNRTNIKKFRGELIYLLQQIVLSDKEILSDIILYIQMNGFDGIKYKSDNRFNGTDKAFNYVIFNKTKLKKI